MRTKGQSCGSLGVCPLLGDCALLEMVVPSTALSGYQLRVSRVVLMIFDKLWQLDLYNYCSLYYFRPPLFDPGSEDG